MRRNRDSVVRERQSRCRVRRAICAGADVIEVATTLGVRRNLIVESLTGDEFFAPLLGEEKKRFLTAGVVELGDKNRAADRISEIVFLVLRACRLKEIAGVEIVIAKKFEHVAVEIPRAGFGDRFDGGGPVSAILSPVIGRQNFDFRNSINVWIGVEGGVAAVIHVVAAVQFLIVVFGATSVHAK